MYCFNINSVSTCNTMTPHTSSSTLRISSNGDPPDIQFLWISRNWGRQPLDSPELGQCCSHDRYTFLIVIHSIFIIFYTFMYILKIGFRVYGWHCCILFEDSGEQGVFLRGSPCKGLPLTRNITHHISYSLTWGDSHQF